MTPEAWNDIVERQAQISKLVEYRRALSQLDGSRSIVFRMCHINSRLGFWIEAFGPAAVRQRRDTQKIVVRNSHFSVLAVVNCCCIVLMAASAIVVQLRSRGVKNEVRSDTTHFFSLHTESAPLPC